MSTAMFAPRKKIMPAKGYGVINWNIIAMAKLAYHR